MGRILSAGSQDPGAALGVISPGGKGDFLPKSNWELPSEAEIEDGGIPPRTVFSGSTYKIFGPAPSLCLWTIAVRLRIEQTHYLKLSSVLVIGEDANNGKARIKQLETNA